MFGVQDAKLKLTNGSWLLSPAIQGIFPYVETHYGFAGALPLPSCCTRQISSKSPGSDISFLRPKTFSIY